MPENEKTPAYQADIYCNAPNQNKKGFCKKQKPLNAE